MAADFMPFAILSFDLVGNLQSICRQVSGCWRQRHFPLPKQVADFNAASSIAHRRTGADAGGRHCWNLQNSGPDAGYAAGGLSGEGLGGGTLRCDVAPWLVPC